MELLGGKAVVNDADQTYIIMTLREFKKVRQEGIEGLTKQELIDKINNDIASWKFVQEEKQSELVELEEISEIDNSEMTYEKT